MFPWEANHRALERVRQPVAERLRKSVTLIDKWCASPGDDANGAPSPTQRFLEFVLAVRSVDPDRAKILVDYILSECGYAPAIPVVAGDRSLGFLPAAVRSNDLNADWLCSVAVAMSDGRLSAGEAQDAHEKLAAVLSIELPALAALHRHIVAFDDAQEAIRKGPQRAPVTTQLRRLAIA